MSRIVKSNSWASSWTTDSFAPTGSIITMASNHWTPDGYLKCDGSRYYKNQYPELSRYLGNRFSVSGDDYANTFRVPDYRGVVLRGNDDGRGLDPGRVIGTYQEDAIRNIVGTFGNCEERSMTVSGAFEAMGTSQGAGPDNNGGFNFKFDASRVVPTAHENRMRNVSVMFYIKY